MNCFLMLPRMKFGDCDGVVSSTASNRVGPNWNSKIECKYFILYKKEKKTKLLKLKHSTNQKMSTLGPLVLAAVTHFGSFVVVFPFDL